MSKRVVSSMYIGAAPSNAPQSQQPKAAGSVYAPAKGGSSSVYAGTGAGAGGAKSAVGSVYGGAATSSAAKPAAQQSFYAPGPKSSGGASSSFMPGAATPKSGPVSDYVADQQAPPQKQEMLDAPAPAPTSSAAPPAPAPTDSATPPTPAPAPTPTPAPATGGGGPAEGTSIMEAFEKIKQLGQGVNVPLQMLDIVFVQLVAGNVATQDEVEKAKTELKAKADDKGEVSFTALQEVFMNVFGPKIGQGPAK